MGEIGSIALLVSEHQVPVPDFFPFSPKQHHGTRTKNWKSTNMTGNII